MFNACSQIWMGYKHFKDKRAKAILHGFIELITNLHVDQIN